MEERLRSAATRIREIFSGRRRLVLAVCFAAGVCALVLSVSKQTIPPGRPSDGPLTPDRGGSTVELMTAEGTRPLGSDIKELGAPMSSRVPSKLYSGGSVDSANAYREPQIAYSAELSVATREFAHSRANLEEILERHHGYVAKLRMMGQPAGSTLSATLRVPSSEYRSALTELKAIGAVEHEEEAADEITQQHSELEARLVNAQNEEKRIQRILQSRDDKFTDQASLERQVAMLRGEIERIQAERYSSGSRASFANVFFSLREERTTPAETIGAKLRNAGLSGLNEALESISTILLFLAGRGPLLALWAVLLYFPVCYFWRRRSQLALSEAQAPKNS
jgi:uncharacterized small protein (DUF1192 family)